MTSTLAVFIVGLLGLFCITNGQKLDLAGVSLNSISYGGTGCPQGSFVKQDSNVNGSAFVFEPFTVQIGPDVAVTEGRANCQISLDISYPANLQYGATGTTYTGYVKLDAGVSGVLGTTYYFSGSTSQVATKYNFNGPSNGEYNVTQNVDDPYVVDQDVIWSPCGSPVPLNINNKITLTSTSDAGYGYIQSDGNFASNFVWRKCA